MNKFFTLVFLLLSHHWVLGQTFRFNTQIRGFGEISHQIYSIAQDQKGFIWAATNQGVKYSDGIVSESIPDSIRSTFNAEQKIWVDDDGQVWVYQISGNPTLYQYSRKSWEKPDKLLGSLDTIAYYTSIDLFTLGSKEEKQVFLVTNEQIVNQKKPMEAPQVLKTEGLGDYYSHFVSETDTLFLFKNGVYRLQKDHFQPEQRMKIGSEDNPLVKMAYLPQNQLYYFLTRKGLFSGKTPYVPSDTVYQFPPSVPVGLRDRFDLIVRKEKVYFFYNSQLIQWNVETRRRFILSAYDDLRIKMVNSALVDREGIIWIGTFRGMANLASTRFQNFDGRSGVPNPDVSAAIMYDRQRYLVGFENGIQAWRGDDTAKTLLFSQGNSLNMHDRVLNFSKDSRGNVWFSAYNHGLGFFNAQTMEMELFALPDGKLASYVWADGEELWVAGQDHIYHAMLPPPGAKPSLSKSNITFPLGDGSLIRKLGRLKNGKWIVLVAGAAEPSEEVLMYPNLIKIQGYDFLDTGDTLFVGTENGYYSLQEESLVPTSVLGQRIERPVYAILKDKNGKVWLGTDSGIILQEEDRLRVFTEYTGLIGNDVARGALVEADKGRILIGTENGVSVYYPEEDQEPPAGPLVFLEDVFVFDPEPVETEFPNIPYRLNNIACTFGAVSFSNSPNLVVKYKLEGYHSEWQKLENPRTNQLVFNNLSPGNYRLALKASLAGYPESETVYSKDFQIDHPFYLQFWFILLLIAFLIAVGYGINTLYLQAKDQGVLRHTLQEKTLEIANREDRFRNVWNNSQDGLLLSVQGGKVIAANPTLCEMGSVSEEELRMHGVTYLYSDAQFYSSIREKITEDLQKIDGKGFTQELEMPFKNGPKEIELLISRMKEDFQGKPLYLSVFRDISRKKAFEQELKIAKDKAEEVSQLKSNIISNMSHEIRTPLNGILGSTEHLMHCRPEDEELLGHLEIIKESGERLLQTMTNILDLSEIESDRVNLVLENTNINDFISKILMKHKSAGIKKGILVTSKFPTKPFFANVERKYLEIIVNNIVGNSVKYSEKGMIQVRVEKSGQQLAIQVQDQGVGISKDYLSKLFFPFEQESKGFSRKFEGSGIGLAISKHLVERLDGTIHIESEKGKGTLVKIFLPLDS